MSKRKVMIALIVLVAVFAVSAVSASDNLENITADSPGDDVIEVSDVQTDDSQLKSSSICDENLSENLEQNVIEKDNESVLADSDVIDVNLEIFKYPTEPGDTGVVIKVSNMKTGKPVSGVKLGVSSKFGSKMLTTDSEGLVTYYFPTVVGTYMISAGLYLDVDATSSWVDNIRINDFINEYVTFSKVPVTLTTSFGKSFQVKVVSSNNKNPVRGVEVYLKIYTGSKYKQVTLKTDENGIVKFNPGTLSVGKHKIVASVDNKNAVGKSKTTTITIAKHVPKITAPKKRNLYKTGNFKITVTNKKYGNVMSGVKVQVKVYTGKKYKTFNVKTNSKGIATISTKALSKGTHKVVMTIKSNSHHREASAKGSIVIVSSKIQPTIGFSGKVYEYHYASSGLCDGVTIYPKLVAQGKLLNKKLTVKTPAGTYTGVSGEGIFLPNVYSDTGYPVFVPITYHASATVTSAEDNYYMKATYTINF